ncbi:MAG: VWA domain-containing protein, partial [Erysipelotrichaceae bacterium]|nr:VWA domain-containing protein [Erysipelotrichaceae bacterium]
MTELEKQGRFTSIDSVTEWSQIAGETGEKLAGSLMFYEPQDSEESISKTDSSQTAAGLSNSASSKLRVSLITKAVLTEDEYVIETIEGDVNGEVKEVRYDFYNDDEKTLPVFKGFLLVPDQPDKPEVNPEDYEPEPTVPEEKEEEKKDDKQDEQGEQTEPSEQPENPGKGVVPAAVTASRNVQVKATFSGTEPTGSFTVKASDNTTFTLTKSNNQWSSSTVSAGENLTFSQTSLSGYAMGTAVKETQYTETSASSLVSGNSYVIKKNNQYVKQDGTYTSNLSEAALWTYGSYKSGFTTYYTLKSGSNYLTYSNNKFGVSTTAPKTSWTYSSSQLKYGNTNTSSSIYTRSETDIYTIPFSKKDVQVKATFTGGEPSVSSFTVTASDQNTFTISKSGTQWQSEAKSAGENLTFPSTSLTGYTMGTVSKTTQDVTKVTGSVLANGEKYIIKTGTGDNSYLGVSGTTVAKTYSKENAAVWTCVVSGNKTYLTYVSGTTTYYLKYANSSYSLVSSTTGLSSFGLNNGTLTYNGSNISNATVWTTQRDVYTIPFTKDSQLNKEIQVTATWPAGAASLPDSISVTASQIGKTFVLNSGNGWTQSYTVTLPAGVDELTLDVPAVSGYSYTYTRTSSSSTKDVYTISYNYNQSSISLNPKKQIDYLADGEINSETDIQSKQGVDLTDIYRLKLSVQGTQPMNVLFVVDMSGSMRTNYIGSKTRWQTLKDTLFPGTQSDSPVGTILQNTNNYVAVTSFSTIQKTSTAFPSENLQSGIFNINWSNSYSSIKDAFTSTSIVPNWATDYMQGLQNADTLMQGLKDVNGVDRTQYKTVMIFISDGAATEEIAIDSQGRQYAHTSEQSATEGYDENNHQMYTRDERKEVINYIFGESTKTRDAIASFRSKYPDMAINSLFINAKGLDDQIVTGSTYKYGDLLRVLVNGRGQVYQTNDAAELKRYFQEFLVTQANNIDIYDPLSNYVDWMGEDSDLLLTFKPESGNSIILYENGAMTAEGQARIKSIGYDADDRTVYV